MNSWDRLQPEVAGSLSRGGLMHATLGLQRPTGPAGRHLAAMIGCLDAPIKPLTTGSRL